SQLILSGRETVDVEYVRDEINISLLRQRSGKRSIFGGRHAFGDSLKQVVDRGFLPISPQQISPESLRFSGTPQFSAMTVGTVLRKCTRSTRRLPRAVDAVPDGARPRIWILS